MIQVKGTLSNTPAVSNYESLKDKPMINGVELLGDKTTDDLGIVDKEQFEQMKDDLKKAFEEQDEIIKQLQKQTEDLQESIEGLIDGNEVEY